MASNDPWADMGRFKPLQCAVCDKCYLDTLRGKCIAGGPFTGFIRVISEPKEAEVNGSSLRTTE